MITFSGATTCIICLSITTFVDSASLAGCCSILAKKPLMQQIYTAK